MNILIIKQDCSGVSGTNVQLKNIGDEHVLMGHFVSNKPSFKEYDLLILPTSEMHLIPTLLKNNTIKKILVWCLGYGAFKEAWFNSSLNQSIFLWFTRKLAKYLIKQDLLAFSDFSGYMFDTGCSPNRSVPQELIIPITIKCSEKKITKLGDDFVWVGRLSYDFKFLSLKRLIMDLNKFSKKLGERLTLDVIGDGEAKYELLEFSSTQKNIQINFLGTLKIEEINRVFLLERYRVMFGMGTSVLEASKLGLPTVIVMPMRTTSDFNELCAYRSVIETKGMSMGEFSSKNNGQLNERLEDILTKMNVENLIEDNYIYSQKFCSKNIAQKTLLLGGSVSNSSLWIFKLYLIFKKIKVALKWLLK